MTITGKVSGAAGASQPDSSSQILDKAKSAANDPKVKKLLTSFGFDLSRTEISVTGYGGAEKVHFLFYAKGRGNSAGIELQGNMSRAVMVRQLLEQIPITPYCSIIRLGRAVGTKLVRDACKNNGIDPERTLIFSQGPREPGNIGAVSVSFLDENDKCIFQVDMFADSTDLQMIDILLAEIPKKAPKK